MRGKKERASSEIALTDPFQSATLRSHEERKVRSLIESYSIAADSFTREEPRALGLLLIPIEKRDI